MKTGVDWGQRYSIIQGQSTSGNAKMLNGWGGQRREQLASACCHCSVDPGVGLTLNITPNQRPVGV